MRGSVIVGELAGLGFKDEDIQSITGMSDGQLRKAKIGELEPLYERHAAARYLAFIRNARKYIEALQKKARA